MDEKDDIFKDLEKDIERRRKEEKDKEKGRISQQLEKHYEGQGKTDPRVIERAVLVSIILILFVYIAYDLVSVHPSLKANVDDDEINNKTMSMVNAAIVNAAKNHSNASVAATATSTTVTTTTIAKAENSTNSTGQSLSGEIKITVDSIDKEKIEDNLAKINRVTFTIENGKSKPIAPIVNLYIFDSNTIEAWSTTSRGEFISGQEIPSGAKQTGIIEPTTKMYSDLNLQKTLILKLNNTLDSELVTATKDFSIN